MAGNRHRQLVALGTLLSSLGALVAVSSEYGLLINPSLSATVAYTIVVTALINSLLPRLELLEKLYRHKLFEALSPLLYLPAVVSLFLIGYELGGAVSYSKSVAMLVASTTTGVAATMVTLLILEALVNRMSGGDRL